MRENTIPGGKPNVSQKSLEIYGLDWVQFWTCDAMRISKKASRS
jgi:hypothetical protein